MTRQKDTERYSNTIEKILKSESSNQEQERPKELERVGHSYMSTSEEVINDLMQKDENRGGIKMQTELGYVNDELQVSSEEFMKLDKIMNELTLTIFNVFEKSAGNPITNGIPQTLMIQIQDETENKNVSGVVFLEGDLMNSFGGNALQSYRASLYTIGASIFQVLLQHYPKNNYKLLSIIFAGVADMAEVALGDLTEHRKSEALLILGLNADNDVGMIKSNLIRDKSTNGYLKPSEHPKLYIKHLSEIQNYVKGIHPNNLDAIFDGFEKAQIHYQKTGKTLVDVQQV
jgi:hypothetical protein